MNFEAESKAYEPKPLWFYFRLDSLTGKKLRLRLLNSAQCLGLPGNWNTNQPVYRENGCEWKRVEHSKTWYDEQRCIQSVFEIELTGDSVEFAFCFPYQTENLMKTISECKYFKASTIGMPCKNRPIIRLANDFGDDKKAKKEYML